MSAAMSAIWSESSVVIVLDAKSYHSLQEDLFMQTLSIPALLALFLVGAALIVVIASRIRTIHLALGFATTALMWVLAYIALLAPGLWIGEALFVATLDLYLDSMFRRSTALSSSPPRNRLGATFL